MKTMPTLFLGHGSPMNAITHNKLSEFLQKTGQDLPTPKAILAVSAHWVTRGTKVQKLEQPPTIHDFYGFPQELANVQYPAPGAPALADDIAALLQNHSAETLSDWGLDHGTWSLLRHMYPEANIPVLQLSLNANLDFKGHYELAQSLRSLRQKGVLILGSGNITHNLRTVNFRTDAAPADWAIEFDELIKTALTNKDLKELFAQIPEKHRLWKQAHPSVEHYIPLLYALGASSDTDTLEFPFHEIQNSTLSMRTVFYR